MYRRRFLTGTGAVGAASLAGCGAIGGSSSPRPLPLVEDRPSAVYVPSHVEAMDPVGTIEAGRLRLRLSYSYIHRFWLVDGTDTTKVDVDTDRDVHLMLSAWDAETGTVIPTANPSVTLRKDGEEVREKSLWRMLAQNMGVHYGDNVELDGDGTYSVDVSFGPVGTRTTGGFADAFGEAVESTLTWEYSERQRDEIAYDEFDEDRRGERDAAAPMQMGSRTVPQLEPADDLPGTTLGTGSSGDATFVVTLLEEPPTGIDASGPYLAVSPRTPYNRFPLPFMALSATLAREDETVYDDLLTPTLDPDLEYHYGATVADVESGDSLTITPETPPQLSRHEGYETAFLDMPPIEMGLDL